MRSLLLLASLLTACGLGSALAQPHLLTGTLVQASDDAPLTFATAVAYRSADSTIAASATTDDAGAFSMSVDDGAYYLVAQYLGYDDRVVPDLSIDGPVDFGQIALAQSGIALETVTVAAERSQTVMKLDKRVFNVAKDITGAGNTAADILNNVPSVNVDPEGNVSLRGSNGVRILVDGKPSAMLSSGDLDALRRMQGDIIEAVEVITNPSARYEAEGEAGIINIILKKNEKVGVNGSFSANAGYPANFGGSYSLNYRRNAFNLFSNFGISYRRSPGGGSNFQRTFDDAGNLEEIYETVTDQDRGGIGGNFQLGTDWFVDDDTQLTGYLLYRRSKDVNYADVTYRDLDEDLILERTTLRDVTEDSNNENLEASLNFKRGFAEKDREWTAVAQYSLDDDLEVSDILVTASDELAPTRQASSNTEYETNLLLQTDYVHPFSDSVKVEGGLRTTLRTIENAYRAEQQDGAGEFLVLPGFDDELTYNENIYAAYGIASAEFGPLGLQAGLRAELSDVSSTLLKAETTNEQDYANLFPSASVSYQVAEPTQLQLSYSRRLSRPYFRLLLPFSNFNNPRQNSIGNPTLRPEYTDSYEASVLRYLTRGSVLASVYYRHTTGVIERLILPTEVRGEVIRFPVNLGERDAYGLELNVSYDLASWYTLTTDLNGYRADVSGSFEGEDYSAEILTWNARVNNRFDVSDRLQVQATFDYDAPQNTTQGRDLAVYAFDVGGSLDVLDGKGTLTLSGRDLFNTRIRQSIIDRPDIQAVSDFQWRRAQSVTLSFVYRLNQGKSGRGGGEPEDY